MQKSGIRVGDIMTRNFIYVSPNTDLRKCAKTLYKQKIGSLIIKEKDSLLGILTEKDIIWAIVKKSEKELKNILAKDIMKRKVYTIRPSADILEAIQRFKKRKIRRLPVIENGKVIGILTQKDIIKIEPGLFQMIVESVRIKEQTAKLKAKKRVNSKKDEDDWDKYQVY